ncbi:hypothetical protein [Arthrobacter sp. NA-172]|uniref:hypothetical protein n=1 Tax=Arthrobacter sp. NA-172 TaxID=3367524 RepID=UPI0037549239
MEQSDDVGRPGGAGDPDRLAEELILILNGAFASADVLGGNTYGTRALSMARRLIDEECRTPITH